MMHRRTREKRSAVVRILAVVICILLAVDVVMLFWINRQVALHHGAADTLPSQIKINETMATDQDISEEAVYEESIQQTTEQPVLIFPYEIEAGMLVVDSLFQFTGMNPDAGMTFGENIAGIQVTNASDKHLTEAEIQAVMLDGTTCNFLIQDLPAGMSATVFSPNNETLKETESCVFLVCQTSFESDSPLMASQVQITVEGTAITVENVSGESLSDLTVCCHCVLDSEIFGGLTYLYPVGSLGANESIVIDAVDCFLGEAVVVRIALRD